MLTTFVQMWQMFATSLLTNSLEADLIFQTQDFSFQSPHRKSPPCLHSDCCYCMSITVKKTDIERSALMQVKVKSVSQPMQ
jgi:hypothetical protein